MTAVSYFTPIDYGKHATSLQTTALGLARYFSWGDKEVVVIKNATGVLEPRRTVKLWWLTVLKIMSYMTVIIPLILFLGHALLHTQHTLFSVKTVDDLLAPSPRVPEKYWQAVEDKMAHILAHRDGNPSIAIDWVEDCVISHTTDREVRFRLKALPHFVFFLGLHADSHLPNLVRMQPYWDSLWETKRLCWQKDYTKINIDGMERRTLKHQGHHYQIYAFPYENKAPLFDWKKVDQGLIGEVIKAIHTSLSQAQHSQRTIALAKQDAQWNAQELELAISYLQYFNIICNVRETDDQQGYWITG